MARHLLAAASVAAALLAPGAPAAVVCTLDTCWFTQPVCSTRVVDCAEAAPPWGCTTTVVRDVCLPDPREYVPVGVAR